MRFLFALLLTIALTANAFAAAAQARGCCPGDDCDVVQCVEMGCLPALNVMLQSNLSGMLHLEAARETPRELVSYLPNRYKEIWTPPD